MHRFHDPFDIYAFAAGLPGRQTTRSPVTSERMVGEYCSGERRHLRIPHQRAYQAADDDTFIRLAKQIVVVVGFSLDVLRRRW